MMPKNERCSALILLVPNLLIGNESVLETLFPKAATLKALLKTSV